MARAHDGHGAVLTGADACMADACMADACMADASMVVGIVGSASSAWIKIRSSTSQHLPLAPTERRGDESERGGAGGGGERASEVACASAYPTCAHTHRHTHRHDDAEHQSTPSCVT